MNPMTFRQMLDFSATRTIERELTSEEIRRCFKKCADDNAGGVRFTDGAAMVCVLDHGFTGSDVTPADPIEVVFYAIDAMRWTQPAPSGAPSR